MKVKLIPNQSPVFGGKVLFIYLSDNSLRSTGNKRWLVENEARTGTGHPSEASETTHKMKNNRKGRFTLHRNDDESDQSNIRYFISFQGSSVVHVVSAYVQEDDVIVSKIPQHNTHEHVKVSIFKAYKNKKPTTLNECYTKVDKVVDNISYEYLNDDATKLVDNLIESLNDLSACHEMLHTAVSSRKELFEKEIDCKLNFENRISYLIRFKIDVHFSLGFNTQLNEEELSTEVFSKQRRQLLEMLKESEFHSIHRIFSHLLQVGSSRELNMNMKIIPMEPAFLYFSSFDDKNRNFIREYTNGISSLTTSLQNKTLTFNQKICIITNIFSLGAFENCTEDSNVITNTTGCSMGEDTMNTSEQESNQLSVSIPNRCSSVKASSGNEAAGHQDILLNCSPEVSGENVLDDPPNHPIECVAAAAVDNENNSINDVLYNNNASKSSCHFKSVTRNNSTKKTTTIKKYFSTANERSSMQYLQRCRGKARESRNAAHHELDELQSDPQSRNLPNSSPVLACKSNEYLTKMLESTFVSSDCGGNGPVFVTEDDQVATKSEDYTGINSTPSSSEPTAPKASISLSTNNHQQLNNTAQSIANIPAENNLSVGESVAKIASTSNIHGSLSTIKSLTKDKTPKAKKAPKNNHHHTFAGTSRSDATQYSVDEVLNIREFLDKEIIYLDNDTSFKSIGEIKNIKKPSKKSLIGSLNLFKRDKTIEESSISSRRPTVSNTIRKNDKPGTLVKKTTEKTTHKKVMSLKKFSTSTGVSSSKESNADMLNMSLNSLFANTENDQNSAAKGSILSNVETWSSMMDPKDIKKLGSMETKRQDIIYELIYTENQYVRALKTLHQVMYKGLVSCACLNVQTVDQLLPNLTCLITVHGMFLADLISRQNSSKNYLISSISDISNNQFSGPVGDAMAEAYAKVYAGRNTAVQLYKKLLLTNKDFNQFVTACANRPQLKRFSIPEFIMFIAQRPSKYPILMQEILRNTKVDSPDYEASKEAFTCSKRVVNKINTLLAEYENERKIDEIMSKVDRKLEWVFEGRIFSYKDIFIKGCKCLHSSKVIFRTKQRTYDIVMMAFWTHIVLLVEKDQKYTLLNTDYAPIIPMQDLILRLVATDKRAYFLVDKVMANIYEIVCNTCAEKTEWVDMINKHIKDHSDDFTFKRRL